MCALFVVWKYPLIHSSNTWILPVKRQDVITSATSSCQQTPFISKLDEIHRNSKGILTCCTASNVSLICFFLKFHNMAGLTTANRYFGVASAKYPIYSFIFVKLNPYLISHFVDIWLIAQAYVYSSLWNTASFMEFHNFPWHSSCKFDNSCICDFS